MKRSAKFLALTAAILASSVAQARGPGNYDSLADLAPVADVTQLRASATSLGGAITSFDDERGLPSFMWAVGRHPASTKNGHELAAMKHLKHFAPAYGLPTAALQTANVAHVHDTGRGGIIVTLRQHLAGIEVFQHDAKVLMRRNGELVAVSGSLSPLVTPQQPPAFALTPQDVIAKSFDDLFGVAISPDALSEVKLGPKSGNYERFELQPTPGTKAAGLGFSEPARVKPVLFAGQRELVPAYFVELYAGELAETSSEYYRYVIAADDGRILYRQNLTAHVDYRVWADADGRPLDGPIDDYTPHPVGDPDGSMPAFIAPSLVTMDGFNSYQGGPPDPWLPHPWVGQVVDTYGNNVDAYSDHQGPDGYGNGDIRALVTGPNTFDRVYDTAADPLVSEDQTMASITQLFYVNNWLHNWFYDSGFDEAAGNAQWFNFGRGGLEGDPLHAEAQDGALAGFINNANMATPADGVAPRMQMYVFSGIGNSSLIANPGAVALGGIPASFGPQDYNLSAPLVLADDGVAPVNDGCEPIVNNVAGSIALIDRGACFFGLKVANAEAAGAVGVVIANNIPGDPAFSMSADPDVATIPAMMITFEEGDGLKIALGGGPVTLDMFAEAPVLRDGTIDNMIIAHEWGHFIHMRLTTGGNLMYGGVSEGWGDFLALYMSAVEGDDLDGTYGVGIYAPVVFGDSGYSGIRRYAYSVDPTKNGLSFRHISNGEPLPATNGGPNGAPNSEVHNAGEVWSTMMWEAYVALLKQTETAMPPYDFDEAQRRMGDYVVAGMQLTPTSATFTEARDGILAAALAADPSDAAVMAQAFATRGAGSCAESPPRFSGDLIGVVESSELLAKVAINSIEVTDVQDSCDSDGVLDGGELGTVTVEVSNGSLTELSDGELQITTSTPGVFFPSGNAVTLPTVPGFESTTATVDIALADSFVDIESLDLEVTVNSATACEATTLATSSTLINLDDVLAVSATETVESATEVWTKTGDPADEVWAREALGDLGPLAGLSPTEHVWHGVDFGSLSDTAIESPDLEVDPANPLIITFDHVHDFEWSFDGTMTLWDGGVIEITNDDGATWTDISAYADPGYTGVLFTGAGNPLSGQMGYGSQNPSFPMPDTVSLDLGTTFAGETVRLRFRIGTDQAVGAQGWFIDNIDFQGILNTPFGSVVPHQGLCQQAPIAYAGEDQTVESGEQVFLDAAGSYDPEGDPITIDWSQAGGDPVNLFIGLNGTATFVAPVVAVDTSFTFAVDVSDGIATSTDTVDIFVLAEDDGMGGGGVGGEGEGGMGEGANGTGGMGEGAAGDGGEGDGGDGDGGGDDAADDAVVDDACGCRVVGGTTGTNPAWLLTLGLGLILAAGRRRRRAA